MDAEGHDQPSYLAEVNAGLLRFPLEDPGASAFRDGVAPVLALAESQDGYLGRRTAVRESIIGLSGAQAGPILLNVSLWTDYDALHAFTYRGLHGRYLSARARWFVPLPGRTTALWWHPLAELPSIDEAVARLLYLRRYGPGPRSFSVLHRFDREGARIRRAGSSPRDAP